MRRRTACLLVLLSTLLLPTWAEAEGYLVRVRGEKDELAEKVERLDTFRSSGLSSLRELRNLPGTFVASMAPSTASLMAEEGYDVEFLPERHALGDPPWSLDRENQRTLPLDGDTAHPYTGRGTRIFILDTGLYQRPDEFGERFLGGTNYVPDGKDIFATCGEAFTHATSVASAALGNSFGVAPGASFYLLRVIGCDNFVWGGGLLSALDDLVTWRKKNPKGPVVVNMSFGGVGRVVAEEKLLQMLAKLGVILIDAAGNDNKDACTYGPAGSPDTITVGASDTDDTKATFSNWGSCVDLFAPGHNVPIVAGDPIYSATSSGTSVSAPAVVGAIALLYEEIPDLSPAEVRKALLANATGGVLVGALGKGSPNRLLFTSGLTEEVTLLIPRWFPAQHRLTTQVAVSLNGKPTPFDRATLYAGLPKDGHCQGAPFATVHLVNGYGATTLLHLNQAPAYVCVVTRAGTVHQRYVQTLR